MGPKCIEEEFKPGIEPINQIPAHTHTLTVVTKFSLPSRSKAVRQVWIAIQQKEKISQYMP